MQASITNGLSPVHFAATCANLACIELVLQNGGDVDTRDAVEGWTALHHVAASDGDWTGDDFTAASHAACFLLCKGARLDIEDRNGRTALQLAAERGNALVLSTLQGADGSDGVVGLMPEHGTHFPQLNAPCEAQATRLCNAS